MSSCYTLRIRVVKALRGLTIEAAATITEYKDIKEVKSNETS